MKTSFLIIVLVSLIACTDTANSIVESKQKSAKSVSTILDEHCSYCHVPPKPSAHPSDEWHNIVFRMQKHRLKRGLKKLNDDEFQMVVTYLEREASE